MVTVVTCADRRGAFPRACADAPAPVWRFLAEQCRALAAGRLGTPVLVVDRALLAAAAAAAAGAARPPPRLAYVDTAPLARAARPAAAAAAAEWVSVVDGYNLLNRGGAGARPFHLWVLGAADLFAPVLAHVAAKTRLVYAQLDCAFAGAAWPLPRRGPAVAGAWPPYETPALAELRAAGAFVRMVYEVVEPRGEGGAPARPSHGGRGGAPRCALL
ncbi:virion protein US2 [Cervid alphaherpesvirus 2]|uniref:Virion protein US2 n=1 Tax=Cervid alphaherpesvirus 2 TaxID=365327 RepID=A0A455JKG4_9ALPH|nr:virion protein US2 [Cervid alphaherpesvirus 2]AVT50785.1 virion protein US2 [Cervid alphaherpesvirus 2]